MWTKRFWLDAAERAVKTAAEVAAGAILVANTPIWDLDWGVGIGITATATVGSVLASIISSGVGNHQSASALDYVGRHRAE